MCLDPNRRIDSSPPRTAVTAPLFLAILVVAALPAFGATRPAAGLDEATLVASDGAAGDLFAFAAAGDGTTFVFGAPFKDAAPNDNCGEVYVFVAPLGGWTGTVLETARLVASDCDGGDELGYSVDVSGDTVVAAARIAGVNQRGKVYVWVRPPGGWSGLLEEDAQLLASDALIFAGLSSVAISGDFVVAGCPADDDNGPQSGSAYLFEKPGGGWSGTIGELAKLLPSDGDAGDRFGTAVAIDATTILVGAPFDEAQGTSSGSVYLFVAAPPSPFSDLGDPLPEEARLVRADGEIGDLFGNALALRGPIAVVGAPSDDDVGAAGGSAYVFLEPAGGWEGDVGSSAKLLPSTASRFGTAVALDDGLVSIGAPEDGADNFGALYLFPTPFGGWSGAFRGQGRHVAGDAATGDGLGNSIALSGTTALAGAANDDAPGADSGSAHAFDVNVLFFDGFHTGTTAAWSAVVP